MRKRIAFWLFLAVAVAVATSGVLTIWQLIASATAFGAAIGMALWYLFRTHPVDSRYAWPEETGDDMPELKVRKEKKPAAKSRDDQDEE